MTAEGWDELYAKVITATGWTWDYLDECLTLPRLNALLKHWQSSPPVHITSALVAGIQPAMSTRPKIKEVTNADLVANMHSDPRKVKWMDKVAGRG